MKSIPNYRLLSDQQTDLAIERVHVDDLAVSLPLHQHQIDPHRHHDLLHVVFLRQGTGTIFLEENEHPFEAPVFILVPPAAVHAFAMSDDLTGELVTLTTAYLELLLSTVVGASQGIARPVVLQGADHAVFLQQADALFRQLKSEYNAREAARELILQSLASLLFAKLIRYRLETEDGASGWGRVDLADGYYRQFHTLIGQQLSQRLSVAGCAATLRITATHLNRVCRQIANQSALQVIHDRLVAEAKRSLLYTVLSVAEVGYQLGFSDPSYFSRFFKTQTGETPKQYQARLRRTLQD